MRFLGSQRWFGAKGSDELDARVDGLIPLPWDAGALAIARVQVRTTTGEHRYQLPVAARADLPRDVPANGTIGRVTIKGDRVCLYDAAHDGAFRAGLARALGEGFVAQGDDLRWVVTPVARSDSVPVESRVGSAEQSNTSIVFGDAAILKLFRVLRPGPQPDLEVTRYLTTRAGFAHTPALLGEIHLEQDGERVAAGIAQRFMPGSIDGWTYALDRSRPYFLATGAEPLNEFLHDARRLGEVTREMHEALASGRDDDFVAAPASPSDLAQWVERTKTSMRAGLGLLGGRAAAAKFPADRRSEAQALVGRRATYELFVDELAREVAGDLGLSARVHGDYHLGQVLRTADDDFMIIDFEGEPLRSIEERRARTSPLRDVAGMLRSFAYAAATLAMEADGRVPPHVRELRSARWERDVRAAYLDGYQAGAPSRLLPKNPDHARALIKLFEAEKVFYELKYELENRPDWVWIPMRGVARLLTKERP